MNAQSDAIKIHPAAECFPMIADREFVEFKASIAAQGLLQPIKTHKGLILDGRNRLRACEEIGTLPKFEEVETDDPLGFIIAANLQRRHLSTPQRAAIAAELAQLEHGTNRYANKVEGPFGPSTSPKTVSEAAEAMHVSRRSVVRAKTRMREDPEAHEAVKRGEKPPKPHHEQPPEPSENTDESDPAEQPEKPHPAPGKEKVNPAAAEHRQRIAEGLRKNAEMRAELDQLNAKTEAKNAADPEYQAWITWAPIDRAIIYALMTIELVCDRDDFPACPPDKAKRLLGRWSKISEFLNRHARHL